MLPGEDDFESLIKELVEESKPVNVAMTPVSITVSTSATEDTFSSAGIVAGDEDDIDNDVTKRPRGRPKGSKNLRHKDDDELPLCARLPEDPGTVDYDTDLDVDISHLNVQQRRRYWVTRKAAYDTRKAKGLI